ncbi:hypothetical protein [Streptomyces asiaticus]|uniref:hypothetical protein n=1 Tax=Streptomyces asiaticus TaxID=114695 RepID=UPI0038219ADE
MANQHSEKLRGIRQIPDQLWADFEASSKCAGTDRSAELRRFMEWYVHRPGAELPERPAPPAHR